MTLDDYRRLSPDEKKALRAERRDQAVAAVRSGDFPTGVRVKVGEFTLTCRPTGVSEKGSIAYSHPPMVLNIGGRKVRINQISISVLNELPDLMSDSDLDGGEVL